MILTCPNCATGYLVDDGRIPAQGRVVRCSACGTRWTAVPAAAAAPLELVAPAIAEPPAKPAPAEPAHAKTAPAILPPRPGPRPFATAPVRPAADLPREFRDRAEEAQRLRRAALSGAAWAGGIVLVAALAGAALFFRGPIAGVWPQTASAYAALGFPVNLTGLAIEQVRAEPTLEAGHAALAVAGVIRNVVDRPVSAPPLRISLVNQQGKRVAGVVATLANPLIPPGAQRRFSTAILDPPFSANTLQIDFAIGARPTTARRVGAPPPGASAAAPGPAPSAGLRGPQAGAAAPDANAAPAPG